VLCDIPCCWRPIESGAWCPVLAVQATAYLIVLFWLGKYSDSRGCIIARTYQRQIDDP